MQLTRMLTNDNLHICVDVAAVSVRSRNEGKQLLLIRAAGHENGASTSPARVFAQAVRMLAKLGDEGFMVLAFEWTHSELVSRRIAPSATHAFTRRPLSCPFRPFTGPILKGSKGSI